MSWSLGSAPVHPVHQNPFFPPAPVLHQLKLEEWGQGGMGSDAMQPTSGQGLSGLPPADRINYWDAAKLQMDLRAPALSHKNLCDHYQTSPQCFDAEVFLAFVTLRMTHFTDHLHSTSQGTSCLCTFMYCIDPDLFDLPGNICYQYHDTNIPILF